MKNINIPILILTIYFISKTSPESLDSFAFFVFITYVLENFDMKKSLSDCDGSDKDKNNK